MKFANNLINIIFIIKYNQIFNLVKMQKVEKENYKKIKLLGEGSYGKVFKLIFRYI